MAVTLDAVIPDTSSAGNVANLTSGAWTVGAGADRALVGFIATAAGSPAAHSAMEWRGSPNQQALTQVGTTLSIGAVSRLSAWGRINPATAADVAYGGWAAAQDESAIAMLSFTGVDQTTPFGTPVTATGNITGTTGTATVNVPTAPGDYVIACAWFQNANSPTSPLSTPAGSPANVGLYEVEGASLGWEAMQVVGVVATGATTTMAVDIASSDNGAYWGITAFVINASAGGGGGGGPSITGTSTSTPANGSTLTITGTNFGAAQGTGDTTLGGISQVEGSWSDTSIPITVDIGTNKHGVPLNVIVTANGGSSSAAYPLTSVLPTSGNGYVNIVTPNTTSAFRLESTPDLVATDQIEWTNVALVTVYDDGTWSADPSVTSFSFRVWSSTGGGWGAWALQSLVPEVSRRTRGIGALGTGALGLRSYVTSSGITATASGTVPITGSSTASVAVGGVSSTTVPLTGSSSATVDVAASGTGTVPVTSTSAVSVGVDASAAGTVTVTGTSAASVGVGASAAGTLTVTSSSTASVDVGASGSTTIAVTTSSTATVGVEATGSGTIPVTGSATVDTDGGITATVSGTISVTGSSQASVPIEATSTSTVSVTGASAASVPVEAVAAGSISVTGSISASVTDDAVVSGLVSVTGSASVINPITGSSISTIPVAGASSVEVPLTATASGTIPVSGSASVSLGDPGSIVATVTGTVSVTGASSVTVAVGGVGSTTVDISGTASASVNITATVAGSIGISGTASVTVDNAATVSGTVPISGSASATTGFTITSETTIPISGSAAAIVSVGGESNTLIGVLGTSSATVSMSASSNTTVPITGGGSIAVRVLAYVNGSVQVAGIASVFVKDPSAIDLSRSLFVHLTADGSTVVRRMNGAIVRDAKVGSIVFATPSDQTKVGR